MSSPADLQAEFMSSKYFAVVGASSDPNKFGNKVLKWYIEHNKSVTPINPKDAEISGIPAKKSISELEHPTETAISVTTPPAVTLKVLKEAHEIGIAYIWVQPGAENDEVIAYAQDNNIKLIAGGPCVLANGKGILESLEANKL
ncbi:NAD-binding protein [Endogone sp. FLAS-F59071]|nr:NAD-binding protein [Endogone sp. FLAS-F59071]|eukprot:RUS18177.1 NAD-binding protein [Endogone sp. FLAS-F59071]